MAKSNLHSLTDGVRQAVTIDEKLAVLQSHAGTMLALSAEKTDPTEAEEVWSNFKDSGAFDLFLDILTSDDFGRPRYWHLFYAVIVCVLAALRTLPYEGGILKDDNMMSHLKSAAPVILQRATIVMETKDEKENEMVRKAVIVILNRLFLPFGKDREFVESFNQDEVLQSVFGSYMEPIVADTPYIVQNCEPIIIAYTTATFIEPNVAPATRTLVKYGLKNVIDRFIKALENDSFAKDTLVSTTSYLLIWLQQVDEVQGPLVEAGIYLALLRRYWDWVKEERRPNERMASVARELTFSITRLLKAFFDGNESAKSRCVLEMVKEEDLLLLLGKALLSEELLTPACAEEIKYMGDCIKAAGAPEGAKLVEVLKPIWLHVYDCLIDVSNTPRLPMNPTETPTLPDYSLTFETWVHFGKTIGIDKDAVLDEEAERRKKAMGGLVGCSWLKCPLFRDEIVAPRRKMLKCSRCKAAQYCGVPCQKMDWKEGGHKDQCKSKP